MCSTFSPLSLQVAESYSLLNQQTFYIQLFPILAQMFAFDFLVSIIAWAYSTSLLWLLLIRLVHHKEKVYILV